MDRLTILQGCLKRTAAHMDIDMVPVLNGHTFQHVANLGLN